MTKLVGKIVGRWRLQRQIPNSSYGELYVAEDVGNPDFLLSDAPSRVAIRLIEPSNPEDARRFESEISVLMSTVHHSIVKLYGAGETPIETEGAGHANRYFVAMEFVEGDSLAELVAREGSLPVKVIANIGAQVAEALSAIHHAGIVHRDLKPTNIFIHDQTVKLADFGTARMIGEREARPVERVWTPKFMAPEYRSGADIASAFDVYALGASLVLGLTGRTSLQTSRVHEGLLRRDDAPPYLVRIIERTLESDPLKRPTAIDLAHTLGKAAAELAELAPDHLALRTDPGRAWFDEPDFADTPFDRPGGDGGLEGPGPNDVVNPSDVGSPLDDDLDEDQINADVSDDEDDDVGRASDPQLEDPPDVYLNVWFRAGTAQSLQIAKPVQLHVNLGKEPRTDAALVSELVSDVTSALLYDATSVTVLVLFSGGDVTPVSQVLKLPPDDQNILEFELTPRRSGHQRIRVLLLLRGEPLHQSSIDVVVSEAAAATSKGAQL